MKIKKNKNFPTCYIYARSAKKQNPTYGYSIDEQIQNCKQYALTNAIIVKSIFIDDGKSGSTLVRPGLWKLIDALDKQKVNLIITPSESRLSMRMTFPVIKIINAISPSTTIITTENSAEKLKSGILMSLENYYLERRNQ